MGGEPQGDTTGLPKARRLTVVNVEDHAESLLMLGWGGHGTTIFESYLLLSIKAEYKFPHEAILFLVLCPTEMHKYAHLCSKIGAAALNSVAPKNGNGFNTHQQ